MTKCGWWVTILAGVMLLAPGCGRNGPVFGVPEGGDDAPYPIVLAHGFFGFESFAGIDAINYFFGVRGYLAENGELVYTPAVDPFNDSEVRGAQLLDRVQDVLEETGAAKVNLIGHSQGGFDARYVAAMRPDLVASVTTISTPHRGTILTDIILGIVDYGLTPDIIDAVTRLFGGPLWDELGRETSIAAAARQLSTPGSAAFNRAYPDAPGVAYYSLAGRTDLHRGGGLCRVDDAPEFVLAWTETIDPVDPLLAITEALLDGGIGDPVPNDGLVTVSSARWGRFLGCFPADHLDEMGQLVGDLPGLINPWRHKPFYRDLISWLRAQGH